MLPILLRLRFHNSGTFSPGPELGEPGPELGKGTPELGEGAELEGCGIRLGVDKGEAAEALRREALEGGLRVLGPALEAHPVPLAHEGGLECDELARRRILVVEERDGVSAIRVGEVDEVHEALEAEREPGGRDIRAQEAADHAVVATAAAERVAERGVRDLEDRAGVVAHAAHEGRVEDELRARHGRAQVEERLVGLRVEPFGRVVEEAPAGCPECGREALGRDAMLRELCGDTLRADLVELVYRDEGALVQFGRHIPVRKQAGEDATVVDADAASLEPQGVERRRRRRDELDLRKRASLTDDVDVALHELAEAPLLRALGAPHGRDLDRAEHRRQLGAVRRIEAREWHRQVEAQPEVGQVEGVGCHSEVLAREPPLEDSEGQLLVVAAEARVQARTVLHDRGLDFVEAVGTVDIADDAEHALASRLLGGEEIAHATGRIDGRGHPPILAGGPYSPVRPSASARAASKRARDCSMKRRNDRVALSGSRCTMRSYWRPMTVSTARRDSASASSSLKPMSSSTSRPRFCHSVKVVRVWVCPRSCASSSAASNSSRRSLMLRSDRKSTRLNS